jgi:hypothetical protein
MLHPIHCQFIQPTVIQKTLLLTNNWLSECFCSEVVNSKLSAYGVTGTISCVVTCCTVIGCGDANSVLDIILGGPSDNI